MGWGHLSHAHLLGDGINESDIQILFSPDTYSETGAISADTSVTAQHNTRHFNGAPLNAAGFRFLQFPPQSHRRTAELSPTTRGCYGREPQWVSAVLQKAQRQRLQIPPGFIACGRSSGAHSPLLYRSCSL